MIKLIIFDLDGTLFDTAPGIRRAVNRLMAERGHAPLSDALIDSFIGYGIVPLVKQLNDSTQNSLGPTDQVVADFRRNYKATFLDDTQPFPGVVEFLSHWPHEIAVVSNKHDDYIHELIGRSPLSRFHWRHVCGGNTHVRPKPYALPLYVAMRAANAQPEQTLMIGDGLPDIWAARNAGTYSLAVEFGYTSITDLINAGAHARLANYSELSKVIQIFD